MDWHTQWDLLREELVKHETRSIFSYTGNWISLFDGSWETNIFEILWSVDNVHGLLENALFCTHMNPSYCRSYAAQQNSFDRLSPQQCVPLARHLWKWSRTRELSGLVTWRQGVFWESLSYAYDNVDRKRGHWLRSIWMKVIDEMESFHLKSTSPESWSWERRLLY